MAVYQYRCPRCGVFEISRAMGSATQVESCSACGGEARRRYSAPRLNRTPTPLAEALTRAERSRDEPEVVTRVPPRRSAGAPQRPDPRLKHLPKW